MKTVTVLGLELEESYGSSFDPVLTGVAHGLACLFPPVRTVRGSERDEHTPAHDPHGFETDPAGSYRAS